jgi:DNA-binding NarL/FixJ family response regulator
MDVREKNPKTRVLVLTAYSEEENILNAAKGGAKGYVLKGVSSLSLLEAIKTVHAGGVWADRELFSAEVFKEIAMHGSLNAEEVPESEALHNLTKREVEILKLVAQGLTNEEIGKKVFISEKTVKTHLTNIFAKLRVNNRFKAALMVMK